MTETDLISVRATVNLPGLRAGQTAAVNPADAYIAELLDATFIVRVADVPAEEEGISSAAADDEAAGASVDGA